MKLSQILTVTVIAFATLLSCKKSSVDYRPTVANTPDNFSFQAANSTKLSSTYDYTWANSGQTAKISVTSSVTSGTANVAIYDAGGVQVYTGDVQTNGSFVTSTGMAGNWRIHVILSGADGTVSFTVIKQ
jgi:hypothetical protein